VLIAFLVKHALTERIMNPRFRNKIMSQAPRGRKARMNRSIIVKVDWDDEAKVWVAISDDIGIATEADTPQELEAKVLDMIRELLELEAESYSDLPEIPVHFMQQKMDRVRNPHFR
jgi:predicted RNase H-like HicB family nuclease